MKIKNLPHKKNVIHIYTDGACSGNPGPGGLGICAIENNEICHLYSEFHTDTTNNRMELLAIIRAFHAAISLFKDNICIIHSDSAYCVNICNDWIHTWAKNNWLNSKKKEVENLDLIKIIYKYLNIEFFNCQVVKEKGHCGVPGNEIADALATGNKEKINKIIEKNNLSIRLKKLS